MTELDTLLDQCIKQQAEGNSYYDLVLNSNFYIPIHEKESDSAADDDQVTPVILEADGKPYMMLFDTEERLHNWADEAVKFIVLPGHAVVEVSTPELYWALNIGTDFQKEFVPEEISWLKDVVTRCQQKSGSDNA